MKYGKLICLLLTISADCLAQSQGQFRYKRSVSGVDQAGWYVLSLPSDIFENISADFSDLRLYSTNVTDTVESPYLLQVLQEEVSREIVQLPLFNQSRKDGVLYLTFELNNSQKVNVIRLQFEESNYFGYVTMEGSNDQREWFEITRDHRIVSVRNGVDYTLSAVGFPLSGYHYLRAAVTADVPLTLKAASFELKQTKEGVYRDIPLTWNMRTDKKARTSFVDIRLSHYVPVSTISVQTDSVADYYRSVEVQYLRDSAETEKGWLRYYEPLYEGHLTSFTPNTFNFAWQTAREIRLVITDNDNSPLSITGITAAGPEVQLVSNLKPGQNFLLYGADGVRSPSYDLAYFENKIPIDPMTAQIETAEILTVDRTTASALFENKLWLWSLMALMIGGLGFFTIKMIRKKSDEPKE